MGTRWGQIVKEESKNYKGIGEYTKCQSEVFAYSSILLLAASGVCFSVLKNKRFDRIPMKNRVLSSALFGCFSAWYFARVRTRYCQELWLVLDDKIPAKIEEKKIEELE